jgi:hypothetical protein
MAFSDYAPVQLNTALRAEADLFVLATVDAGVQSGVQGSLIGLVSDDKDPENMTAVAMAAAQWSEKSDANARRGSLTMLVPKGKWYMVRAIKDWGEPEFSARQVVNK